jgi:hypothetical protein
VAALSDYSEEFEDSCGRCYELRCTNEIITDGYGQEINRSNACYDTDKSIVVRIVDACPCVYPTNKISNSRWCCNDNRYTHFDLSIWAFEKLAPTSNGVISTEARRVPCDYYPSDPGSNPYGPSPGEPGRPTSEEDRMPDELIFVRRVDDMGALQGAVQVVDNANKSWVQERGIVDMSHLYKTSTDLGLGLGGRGWNGSRRGGGEQVVMVQESVGRCVDVAPTDDDDCEQQKGWGKCDVQWMVEGGFCKNTCGRCEKEAETEDDNEEGVLVEAPPQHELVIALPPEMEVEVEILLEAPVSEPVAPAPVTETEILSDHSRIMIMPPPVMESLVEAPFQSELVIAPPPEVESESLLEQVRTVASAPVLEVEIVESPKQPQQQQQSKKSSPDDEPVERNPVKKEEPSNAEEEEDEKEEENDDGNQLLVFLSTMIFEAPPEAEAARSQVEEKRAASTLVKELESVMKKEKKATAALQDASKKRKERKKEKRKERREKRREKVREKRKEEKKKEKQEEKKKSTGSTPTTKDESMVVDERQASLPLQEQPKTQPSQLLEFLKTTLQAPMSPEAEAPQIEPNQINSTLVKEEKPVVPTPQEIPKNNNDKATTTVRQQPQKSATNSTSQTPPTKQQQKQGITTTGDDSNGSGNEGVDDDKKSASGLVSPEKTKTKKKDKKDKVDSDDGSAIFNLLSPAPESEIVPARVPKKKEEEQEEEKEEKEEEEEEELVRSPSKKKATAGTR